MNFTLSNLGNKKVWREGVLEASALRIRFAGISMKNLVNYCTVEDLRLNSYQNVHTTKEYEEKLPKILAGELVEWKLWKVVLSEKNIELHYIDPLATESPATYRRCSVLLCTILWPHGLKVWVAADPNYGEWSDDTPILYQASFETADDRLVERHRDTFAIRYQLGKELHRQTHITTSPLAAKS